MYDKNIWNFHLEFLPSAILTRSEIKWLNGLREVSKTYEYKMKCAIRKKLDILANTELPLIEECGFFSDELTKFGKTLTIYSKIENSVKTRNVVNCAKIRALAGIWTRDLCLTKATLYQAELPRHIKNKHRTNLGFH